MNHHHMFELRLRRGRAQAWIIFAFMAIVIIANLSRRRNAERPETGAEPSPTSAVRYEKSGDEGLGAAIAIVIDNSGSMEERAGDDRRPKYEVARDAVASMLTATDSFIAGQPDFPIKVGLYHFAKSVTRVLPIQPYNRDSLVAALKRMPEPRGGTAIGEALDEARADLYSAGMIRKYVLVITDGENTDGRPPEQVAREIFRRSEGAVRMYFVAFDIDADKFSFVRDVRGEVLGASNTLALRASLDTIYRGKILAEAMDAGERLPAASGGPRTNSDSIGTKQP